MNTHIALPVVGYGKQSISSLIATGTPSSTEIGSPTKQHAPNEYLKRVECTSTTYQHMKIDDWKERVKIHKQPTSQNYY